MVVLREELGEPDPVAAPLAGLSTKRRPPRPPDSRPQVVEDDLPALAVEIDGAAGRQERELLARPARRSCRVARPGSPCSRSSKRNSRCCWPIRSITVRLLLPLRAAQTATELLGEQRRRLRSGRSSRTQSTSGTSTPSPSTSTENTHRSRPAFRSVEALIADLGRVVARQAMLVKPRLGELARHVSRVLLRDAEPERPHPTRIEHDPLDRFEQLRDADVVAREEVAQLLRRVPAATPGQLAQVRAVSDAEVLERDEEALIDCLPQPQLDGDSMVEPLGDVAAIEPLRRCRQTEQFPRLQVVEEPVIAVGGGVMELVDDDDIERVRAISPIRASWSDWIIAKT